MLSVGKTSHKNKTHVIWGVCPTDNDNKCFVSGIKKEFWFNILPHFLQLKGQSYSLQNDPVIGAWN